jgi:hypothetical protein
MNHYDGCFSLGRTDQDKADLVEFLKSLPGVLADSCSSGARFSRETISTDVAPEILSL